MEFYLFWRLGFLIKKRKQRDKYSLSIDSDKATFHESKGIYDVDSNEIYKMQNLSLSKKIENSKIVIKEWIKYWDNNVYISFSGGKDSTVLMHLVKEVNTEIPVVFCETGIQFPEIIEFVYSFIDKKEDYLVKKQYGYKQKYYIHDNFVILKPKMHFEKIIKKYGYPIISKEQAQYLYVYSNTNSDYMKNRVWKGNKDGSYKISEKWKYLVNAPFKISDKCCAYIKKMPFLRYEKASNRKPIIGTTIGESSNRINCFMKCGSCNGFDLKRPISRPLSFWTEQDTLKYIKEHNINYANIYGQIVIKNNKLVTTGRDRTGCVFCGFGAHLEKTPNRFQKMKESHPKLYDYCINKLGMSEILDYINVPYS